MFIKHRKIKIVLLLSLLWTVFFPLWSQNLLKNPVDEPITLSPPGSVHAKFHIPLEERYVLSLAFERDGTSDDKLHQLLGRSFYSIRGSWREGLQKKEDGTYYKVYEFNPSGPDIEVKTGKPVTVKWEVHSIADPTIAYSYEEDTLGIDDVDKKYFSRTISNLEYTPRKDTHLPPGDYELTVTVVKAEQELSNYNTRIILHLESGIDAPSTGARKFIQWFGILFMQPVVWVLDIVLAIILATRIWRDRRSR